MVRHQRGFAVFPVMLLLLIIALVLIGGMYFLKMREESSGKSATAVSQKPSSTKTATEPYPPDVNWEEINLTASDAQRKKDIELFGFDILAYYLGHGNKYPTSAAEAATTQEKDPLVDPDTKQPYVVVDTTPELGQIQYKISMTCDTYNRNFKELDTPSNNIYAQLMKMSEGSYICKSNIK